MPEEPSLFHPGRNIFERRRFVRIDASLVVSYADVATAQPKTDVTQTKNISVGGILFTTDREFPRGSPLRLGIRVPGSPDYINVKAQVVESIQKVKGLMYETRVKFTGIREEDKDALRKVVEYSLKNRERNR